MSAISSQKIGERICKALGLDTNGVRAVDIHIAYDSIVTISVTRFLYIDEFDALTEICKQYELVEKTHE